MTNWRGVAVTVDDTKAVLDSCNQKCRRRAIRRGKEEGVHNESTYVCELSTVNGGEVGDDEEESLEDLELYVDTLRNAVVHHLDDGQDSREEDGARR